MAKRRKAQNTRDAWRLAGYMLLILIAIAIIGVATK